MPPGKVLQPVLKMKVDELFLCWLSEASTQAMLRDCLRRIAAPGRPERGAGDAGQPGPLVAAAAPARKPGGCDSPGAPGPAPASAALPLGAASSARTGPPVRGTRRSAGTRAVSCSSVCYRLHTELGARGDGVWRGAAGAGGGGVGRAVRGPFRVCVFFFSPGKPYTLKSCVLDGTPRCL